jgi:hypothetical protein
MLAFPSENLTTSTHEHHGNSQMDGKSHLEWRSRPSWRKSVLHLLLL